MPLKRALESLEACKGCEGLAECRQETRGYASSLQKGIHGVYETAKPCRFMVAHRELAEQERVLASSRLPEGLKAKGLRNFDQTEDNRQAAAAATEIAKDPKRKGLILSGQSGCGKTHLAVGILNNRLRTGGRGIYVLMADLLADIRGTYDGQGGGRSETDLMNLVGDAPLLVLDDLGAERMTEWVGETMFRLLDRRVKNELQTVITTNYRTPEALRERLTPKEDREGLVGRRILSRIMDLCEWVEVRGKDRRIS